MGSDSNGGPDLAPQERLNIFALVIYIPDPLGAFLDDLRRRLVPHYNPHAHVSVLPPRALAVDWKTASEQARTEIEGWTPFEVELAGIQVFPETDVIYIEIGAGDSHLRAMHDAMNLGALKCDEPFPYHPHITLAQEIPHADVPAIRERAARHWSEYQGSHKFRAEHAVFVQNTSNLEWLDLARYSLGALTVR